MTIRRKWTGSYTAYLARQAKKATLSSTRERLSTDRKARVAWFFGRFDRLVDGVPTDRFGTALCLGARYGEEVEALETLGWEVKGIDVVPCPPFVVQGDMNAPIKNQVDLIYTNAIDHCWDVPPFLANIRRATRGVFMTHLSDGKAGSSESIKWRHASDVLLEIERAGFRLERVERIEPFYGMELEVVAR